MDICHPELEQQDDEPVHANFERLLGTTWIVVWTQAETDPKESERAAHLLRVALPMVTSEEARLN